MPNLLFRTTTFLLVLCGLAGCKPSHRSAEHIDAEEKAAAAKLKPAVDPIHEEITAFRNEMRKAYDDRRFDELEKHAQEIRAKKQLFADGTWKILHFYESLDCDDEEPQSAWELHESIHEEWLKAKPTSITAHVAYADFLTSFAWQARGTGYADTVTESGFRLMGERLASSAEILQKARDLPENDLMWWTVALRVALGQGWPKPDYDSLVTDALAFEPKFAGYDGARAYSLLPRWYGEPGDWEAYAAEAAARPEGLGAEVYARIVIRLRPFHTNIFRESKISWPKTREGLEQMRKKHPTAVEIVSHSAMLAAMAQDRKLAKEMFDQLGDTYLPAVWEYPERFVHFKKWADTGKW